jgi:hypothetical protein
VDTHDLSIRIDKAKQISEEIRVSKSMASGIEDDIEDHLKLIRIGAFEKMANYHLTSSEKPSSLKKSGGGAKEIIKQLANFENSDLTITAQKI